MEKLINIQKTLMISSKDEEGNPSISYSAYVYNENKIYIYISKIAKHYENLITSPKISVMIIEDEKEAKTVFHRARICFNCIAKKFNGENTEEEVIFKAFDEAHGAKMMKILKTMDFDIFELDIIDGRYIEGFGKVYDIKIIENKLNFELVTYKNHTKK